MENDIPSTLDGVRTRLFAQLDAIRAKTPSPEVIQQSKAVCDLVGRIVETARCEIDYKKMVKACQPMGSDEQEKPELSPNLSDRKISKTASGTLEVVPVAGGALMTHKIR